MSQKTEAVVIWIDTDASIGSPIREVDDAYALILALHSPEITIAGISSSYGNTSLARTTAITRDLIGRFGAPAALNGGDVIAGARSKGDLGRETAATHALATTLRQKQKLTYVALAPLTNLASLLVLHPDLAKKIERVIFVGGKSQAVPLQLPNGLLQVHDANVVKDPAAVAAVLRSKIPVFLTPIETSCRLVLDAAALRELERSGPAGSYLAQRSTVWLWFWRHIAGTRGGPIFDALAVVAATRPQLLTPQTRSATIDSFGNLIATQRPGKLARPVQFCAAFAPLTDDFVRERLLKNARSPFARFSRRTR